MEFAEGLQRPYQFKYASSVFISGKVFDSCNLLAWRCLGGLRVLRFFHAIDGALLHR